VPKQKALRTDLSRAELLLARLALFVAFGFSAYLAWNSLKGGGVPGCGPESDCDKVLSSRWAYLLGLPISVFALPVYAVGLGLLFQKARSWKVLLPVAVTILFAALWFVGLQAFALRAFCKFCMSAHVAGGLAALILLKNNPLSTSVTMRSVVVGAALTGAVIVGQFTSAPPAPVQVVSSSPIVSTSESNAVPTLATNAPDPTFAVVDGQFTLNLKKVPVSGPLNAPKKLAKLFDYTCHHCRDLYHLLLPVKKRYANELAVISLPMPLDANCNSVIKSTQPSHQNACEYARIGLAVFFANPAKFDEFTHWVFTPERPPDVASTRAYAESLIGKEQFAVAIKDPRVEEQIRMDVNIYVASSRLAKRSTMPQMLFARGGSIGAVRNAAILDQILYNSLGLGTPPVTNAAPIAPVAR
jgi:uncharacterized membrane protein